MRCCDRVKPGALNARQAGYTLTEMLVVIGIISLIAAVLTPGLMTQLGRARAKSAQLQLDTIASSVELFRSDVGRYPSQQEGLTALVQEPSSVQGWTGPYVKDQRTLNDPWGTPISYVLEPDGRHFYVESLGADGKSGGSGVDRDLRAPAGP
jgi:general secretion pathway protein G